MTSSPRPYKSRLFNFLNRQRIVLGDRLGKTFRQAKTTAIWGAQILIYPAYLIAQAGRALVWKLEQKVAPIPLPETGKANSEDYIPVDTPVWKTLDRVKPLLETLPGNYEIQTFAPPVFWSANPPQIAPASNIPPQAPQTDKAHRIRGIASTLNQHHLVLATVDNQSLDILTKKQQTRLEETIRWELADYAYRQYLQRVKARQYLIPPALTVNPHVFPPLRWFWQLMRWEQQSQIAIAIDLFNEAQIVPQWQEIAATPETNTSAIEMARSSAIWQPPPPVTDLVVEVDAAIALWETQQDRWRDRFGIWWQESRKSNLNDSDRLAKLQFFLRAAMDYFFGMSKSQTLPASTIEEEPWLAWEELYDRARENFTPSIPQEVAIADKKIQDFYPHTVTPSLSAPNQKPHSLSLQKSASMTADPDPQKNRLSPPQNELSKTSNSLDFEENLLEVDAKITGYVEHPLEKILKLVDRMMAQLEDAIVAIWNFLKRNF